MSLRDRDDFPDRDLAVAEDRGVLVMPEPSLSSSEGTPGTNSLPTEDLIITQSSSSSWKDLFAFTKLSHTATLIGALISSALAAGFKVGLAVVLGQVFNLISDYASGTRSGDSTVSSVARWSFIIFGLGLGNWIVNSIFLFLWVVFGELQASSVRQDTFLSLLSKDMSWFDSQEQGVSSLLARIQT
jgi:ATP-binding cassette, subfamily B (MDR/TAP), member 1